MTATAALSRHPDPRVAVAEVIGHATDAVGPAPALAVLGVSGAHVAAVDDIVDAVDTLLTPTLLVGATAAGLLAGGEGQLDGDGVAIWAMSGIGVTPLRLEALGGEPPLVSGLGAAGVDDCLVLLADEASLPAERLLDALATSGHRGPVAGGSTAADAGLILGRTRHLDGAVGFAIAADRVRLDVAAGCRSIGPVWTVTAAHGREIHGLGHRPAVARVDEVLASLTGPERAMARGLHLGVLGDTDEDEPVRTVLVRGADRGRGVVALEAPVAVGTAVRFQLGDAAVAADRIEQLGRRADEPAGRAALAFIDRRRAADVLADASADARALACALGPGVGGAFCDVPIGPAGSDSAPQALAGSVVLFD